MINILEETGDAMNGENMLHHLEVELNQDLTDTQLPGKIINVTGIIRVRAEGKSNAESYKVFIKANSVHCNEFAFTSRRETFTDQDMEAIQLIKAEPSKIRLLVHSLCPSIYGHDMAKAGLLLGLFSGEKLLKERRSESHVLVSYQRL